MSVYFHILVDTVLLGFDGNCF